MKPNPYERHARNVEASQKAELLFNFLEHAGWAEVLKPRLDAYRKTLLENLCGQTLAGNDKVALTLAGQIAGIDNIVTIIEDIARNGASARADLLASQQTPPAK